MGILRKVGKAAGIAAIVAVAPYTLVALRPPKKPSKEDREIFAQLKVWPEGDKRLGSKWDRRTIKGSLSHCYTQLEREWQEAPWQIDADGALVPGTCQWDYKE